MPVTRSHPEAAVPDDEAPGPEDGDRLFESLLEIVSARSAEIEASDIRTIRALRQAIEALDRYLEAAAFVAATLPCGETTQPAEIPPAINDSNTPDAPPVAAPGPVGQPSIAPDAWADAFDEALGSRGPVERAREPAGEEEVAEDPPDRPPATPSGPAAGFHSRGGFESLIEGELRRCARHAHSMSLFVFDLPDATEEDRKRVAAAIRTEVRGFDLVGRGVGSELFLALPETKLIEAREVGRRVVRNLTESGLWGTAARLGLVERPSSGETLPVLLEAARTQLDSAPERVLTDVPGRDYR